MNKFYEEIEIKDEVTLKSLDAIVSTINYDTKNVMKELFRPEITKEYALSRVSQKALDEIKKEDRSVATLDCNLYKFDNINIDFLHKIISRYLAGRNIKGMGVSGRIWYPENGFMGWHTNSNSHGLRMYCTFAREDNKSFFRYCDPETNEVVTSWDKQGWNFRIFKISEKHLWHSVFSETDRFSIGYTLKL